MPRPPAPLPATFPWNVFTRAEAARAGISVERLRRADLRRLRHGLFGRTAAELTELDIASALCRADPDAAVVGLSSARIQALPLPRHLERWSEGAPVHVSLPQGRRTTDRAISRHALVLGPGDLRVASFVHPASDASDPDRLVLPLRLATRARTWRDLARDLSHSRLVAIGDHLVRRPRPDFEFGRSEPWCSLEDLALQCTGRHAGLLRAALQDVRVGADSPRETLLRLAFAEAGLPEPEINAPLVGADGRSRHTPDFQWPAHRIAAEYDGRSHSEPDQVKRDIARARRVRDAGWTEVRLFAADAEDGCAGAVHQVRHELRAKGWVP